MKKLLSLLIADINSDKPENMPEEIEVLNLDAEKNLSDTFRKIKGRYALLCRGDLECSVDENFFNELGKTDADILTFENGFCLKSSILKGLNPKQCTSISSSVIYALLSSKNITKNQSRPFEFSVLPYSYKSGDETQFYGIEEEFTKSKAKLQKDVYAFAFDIICAKLTEFYSGAILTLNEGGLSAEILREFDLKLKENIVLYLALEKRFTCINLKKLREKDFKINIIQRAKLKKALKTNSLSF